MHSVLGVVQGSIGHRRHIDMLSLPFCDLQSGMQEVNRKEIQALKRYKRRPCEQKEDAIKVRRPVS